MRFLLVIGVLCCVIFSDWNCEQPATFWPTKAASLRRLAISGEATSGWFIGSWAAVGAVGCGEVLAWNGLR
jgi:uncharacterized protein involved in outer membrane biogenesis